MEWWNFRLSDVISTKVLIALFALVLIGVSLFKTREAVFVCSGNYQYCTVTSTNLLKIKTTRNVLMPIEFANTKVESYVESRGGSRHHHYTHRLYNLFAIDKSGRKVKIFDGIYSQYAAKETGRKVMGCVQSKQYPCEVIKDKR